MHTRHEYTKFHGRESRENEITLESPFLSAPSSGYKNKIVNSKIVIGPDSRSRKDLRERESGENETNRKRANVTLYDATLTLDSELQKQN